MGVYQRGKIWYIDYYDQHGTRHRERVGPNKRKAELALAKRKIQIIENQFFHIKKREKITLRQMAELYMKNYSEPNKKSSRRDKISLKNILPVLGDKYLHEISPLDIEKYKTQRIRKVKKSTVNRELACLKHIYNKAIEWAKIDTNPVTKVKFFKENNSRIRFLTKEEIDKLISSAASHLKPVIITALNTGMRKSEILNLKWEDVDFNQKIIIIRETKNKEKREIPMNYTVSSVLLDLFKKRSLDNPFVFKKPGGGQLRDIKTSFNSAVKRAGIKNFRFHDLRHTFASYLVMQGTDFKTVQELMGHKTIQMTLRYSHLSPDHKRRAVEDLEKNIVTIWSQGMNRGKNNKDSNLSKLSTDKEKRNFAGVAE